MKYKLPDELVMNKLKRLMKKIRNEGFEQFIANIKQRVFYISNKTLSVVVVCDIAMEKIEFFNGKDALLSCHGMFAGIERGLDYYGYNYLSIEATSKDALVYQDNKVIFDQNKYYQEDNRKFLYLTHLSGQLPMPINNEDALLLVESLEYLLEIKRLFDDGIEVIPETDEDCVLCFEFDDEQLLYNSHIIALEAFDFQPDLNYRTRKSPRYIEQLKEMSIVPDTLFLSQFYVPFTVSEFNYSNNVNVKLNEIVLYGLTESGTFEFTHYSAIKSQQKKNLKEQVLSIFNTTGLCDLVVTDNYILYLALVDDLEAVGVEMRLELSTVFTSFIYETVKRFISAEDANIETLIDALEGIRFTCKMLVNNLPSFSKDLGEEIFTYDEDDEVDEEELFDSDLIV